MRIPIKAAKEFSNKYDKDVVVVLSLSHDDNQLWVTTYGKNIEDCDFAAQIGNAVKKYLGWPPEKCMDEPHRVIKMKQEIKELKSKLAKEESNDSK